MNTKKLLISRRVIAVILAVCAIFSLAACADDTADANLETVPTVAETIVEPETTEPPETVPEETEPEATEPPEPVITQITMSFVGDCTLGKNQKQPYSGSYNEYFDKYGPDYFFKKVLDVFESDDITVINLEGVLSTSNDKADKKWRHKGRPEFVQIMTGSSVEVATFGNNHSYDYGVAGTEETIQVLVDAGIAYSYEDTFLVYEVKGVKVGIVSVNDFYESHLIEKWEKEGFDYRANEERLFQEGYTYLKEQGCAIVVACPHWGTNHTSVIDDFQIELGHKLVDMGYDLVVGNHPHVLQAMEYYNGTLICYSLGNFSYGGNKNPDDKDSGIFQQTFTLVDGELTDDVDARFIPCSLSGKKSKNNYQPVLLEGEEYTRVINKVRKYSEKFGLILDEDGRPVIPEDTENLP